MITLRDFVSGHRWTRAIAVGLLAALGLAACGGGHSGSAANAPGTVSIGLTDAPGDFLSYRVNVVSLKLTRTDGAVVETLPNQAQVDFAQYTDLTEFLTAATVPSGSYSSVTMRLDYSNADVEVEDANGNAAQATVQDANGDPLSGPLDVTVNLDNAHALVVSPGGPAHLALDFNLSASNSVALGTPPVVTVQPFLVADVNAIDKPYRVRGPLKQVNTANLSFQLAIWPFYHFNAPGDHDDHYGALTVTVDGATTYEIDQKNYAGAAGLQQLAAEPALTAVTAVGNYDSGTHVFLATEVHAGSSVPWGTRDAVSGTVVARSGNVLTVRGATLLRQDGSVLFHDNVAVTVGSGTLVRAPAIIPAASCTTPTGSNSANGSSCGTDSISVGQSVAIFGTVTNAASAPIAFDATNGFVRMRISAAAGSVVSTASNSVVVDLQHINGRRIKLYDFTGTGTSQANDAVAASYTVETGGLSLSGLALSTPVRVWGFPQAWGQATTSDDFNAKTLENASQLPATLVLNWSPATDTPFSPGPAATPNAMMLDATGNGNWHYVYRGGIATDLLALGSAPTLSPRFPLGLYAIGYQATVQLFGDFNKYENALQSRLNSGQRAAMIGARGLFSDNNVTLDTDRAFVRFQ